MKIAPKEEPVERDDLFSGLPPPTSSASVSTQPKNDRQTEFENVTVKRESSPPPQPPIPPPPALKSAIKRSIPPESQPEVGKVDVKIKPKEEPVERDDLFSGLPPPTSSASVSTQPKNDQRIKFKNVTVTRESSPPQAPIPLPPALKSALKRSKPPESQPDGAVPERRIRFKTTTEASEKQVIEAMQKIALHIKNTSKFGKASKLAIQLLQAGSVMPGTSGYFFAILETAMSSTLSCTDPSVRADYHALFTASQDIIHCLDWKQQNQLIIWTMKAVVANDLFTDDSFVFSKATGLIKEAISSLPVATADDDREEAEVLNDAHQVHGAEIASVSPEERESGESDPFGLDALIPSESNKEERSKVKKAAVTKNINEEDIEMKRFLKSKREATIFCLEIAARRYKMPWCQTGIDILVKHAFDNISRFTSLQRVAIQKLWASIRDQQLRRKQGKSVTGKLDMNAFEHLQEKYANEKISIRRAVGGGGDRKAQQWLG
ncbi:unnamed protein product [Rhodiola kirilowii]